MQLPLAGLVVEVAAEKVRPGRKPRVNETALSEEDQRKIVELIQERDRLPPGQKFRRQRLNIGCKIWHIRHPDVIRDPAKLDAARKKWLDKNQHRRKKIALDSYYRNRPPLKQPILPGTPLAAYGRRRRINDIQFCIASRLRATMNRGFRRKWIGKPATTEELLGCTITEAKLHIENQFINGMSWDRRRSFVIDHIIPVAAFDLRDAEESKWAFNWRNLQPMNPHDNATKSDNIPNPFPSWLPEHIANRIRSRQPAPVPDSPASCAVSYPTGAVGRHSG